MNWKQHFNKLSQGDSADFGGFGGGPAPALVDPSLARLIQTKLNTFGAQPQLTVDGDWGGKSDAALRVFQQARGLKVDGVPGTDTLKALGIQPPPVKQGPKIAGLKQSVVNVFPVFSGKFEGQALPYMYTDVKGLVTTGTGNLIDGGPAGTPKVGPAPQPWVPDPALKLPWKKSDGSLASQDEIRAAWTTVKSAWPDTQGPSAQSLTNLRLDSDGLDQLLYGRLVGNHEVLKQIYPNYTSWPADSQLAMHSLSWAWGPGFATVWNGLGKGPLGTAFKTAAAQMNFAALPDIISQASAHEETINPGIVSRNVATKALFSNAADVVAKKADFDSLYWPGSVIALAITGLKWATLLWGLAGAVTLSFLWYRGDLNK
jgi:Putative peptidoglycan binding domain